jgi:NAD(P)-dependent dehydrogenase (short-subunit alcohol dehydrogenase family)
MADTGTRTGAGRPTIVTGGTGGLGVAVVRALADAGHDVVVTWIVEDEVARFPADLRDRCRLERCDVLADDGLPGLVAALEGAPWGLVHLVGGYLDGAPLGEMAPAQWDRQVALNLRSAALALGAVMGPMRAAGGGRVVAVGTRAAVRPFAGASAYAASKAGVIALVGAASEEGRQDGVCVNCVLPSVIDTPANRAAQPDADPARWVSPAELAAVIAFLCSAEASAVSGAAIPVYGRA